MRTNNFSDGKGVIMLTTTCHLKFLNRKSCVGLGMSEGERVVEPPKYNETTQGKKTTKGHEDFQKSHK